MKKEILLMAGPTAIPEQAIKAMDRQVMFHRSKEFEEITKELNENLKIVFQTKNDVLTLTGSGTSAMEAAVQNCFSEGDEVIVVVLGVFSERMARIAETYRLNVKRVTKPLGEVADVEDIKAVFTENTKGVIVIHNESATGVVSDLKAMGEFLKDTQAILITDTVSGMGALEFRMDEWHVDVAFTGSQKALMGPPGLAFISLSDKAWAMAEKSTMPKFYLDLKIAREFVKKNQHPWTPAVYQVIGCNETVRMIVEQGMENIWKRNKELAKMIVEGLNKLGLQLFAKDLSTASTSVCTFAYDKPKQFVAKMKEEYGIHVYGGQDTLADSTFRVGCMGYVTETDIVAFLYAAEKVLAELAAE